jgi:hypothetical protein
LQSFS